MSALALLRHLDSALAALDPGPLCIGYSGGLDSLALLHALASLPAARARGLSAIHVDHGLHTESADWAQHCQFTAAGLQLPLRIVRVAVRRADGDGLEAAARTARLAAFRQHLPAGAILVLAHHADDQTETVLLKLLRGAGPEGLRGMRALRRLGEHLLWRPLLPIPRATLQAYAQEHALQWIDDPSNADTRHARNFLRHAVLPTLRARWPRLDTAVGHSARWMNAATEQLQHDAAVALAQIQGLDPATLAWPAWLQLGDALRPLTLRLWLRGLGLSTPEHVHVEQLQQQLRAADNDRNPCVSWPGAELRRYRGLLYAQAQAAVRDREQFLSIAAHELRTPLTSLLGRAELMQRRVGLEHVVGERDLRSLQIVVDQSKRLNTMIATLLDLSRIQTGQFMMERVPLDLCALMRGLVEEFQSTLERHTLQYSETTHTISVLGDEIRLEQAFVNLLQNAVKYSPHGGVVRVALTTQEQTVLVSISDEGIGIPTEALPNLFTRFYRAPNTAGGSISGMGIGLFVVKEIVDRHDGTVSVRSAQNQGSTFVVALPIAATS